MTTVNMSGAPPLTNAMLARNQTQLVDGNVLKEDLTSGLTQSGTVEVGEVEREIHRTLMQKNAELKVFQIETQKEAARAGLKDAQMVVKRTEMEIRDLHDDLEEEETKFKKTMQKIYIVTAVFFFVVLPYMACTCETVFNPERKKRLNRIKALKAELKVKKRFYETLVCSDQGLNAKAKDEGMFSSKPNAQEGYQSEISVSVSVEGRSSQLNPNQYVKNQSVQNQSDYVQQHESDYVTTSI